MDKGNSIEKDIIILENSSDNLLEESIYRRQLARLHAISLDEIELKYDTGEVINDEKEIKVNSKSLQKKNSKKIL